MAIECQEASKIDDLDVLKVNYLEGVITNTTKKETYQCSKMPDHIMKIIEVGGLVSFLETLDK